MGENGYETITAESREGVLILTLNRPDSLNAVTVTLLSELGDALKEAAADDGVRCIVLTGAGRGFCSGQDLSEVKSDGDSLPLGERVRRHYNPVVRRLRSIEKPVIAAVNGIAAGAGASLAMACDLRVASEDAAFMQAFVKVGLIPDSGGTYILPALAGPARAAEMAFTGRKVDAVEAKRIGMVNRVVPAEELMESALELAAELAALPTKAIGLTKRAFNRAVLPDLDEHLDYEADLQEIASRTEDHQEGVAAFLEKRKPGFKGR
jgi:2-(1,2-epoxy-1,2-dihydrophenyl)acetyl-CoA isomerase